MANQRIGYHGAGGELFVLYLKNIFLTIITLGIYSFWAKTNIQKYLATKVEWQAERLSFHGTGKERFIGFLKAAALIVGIYIINMILGFILGFIVGSEVAGIISAVLILVFFIAVIPFILVGKRRYLTSRTGYRNLRFGFDGKSKELAILFLKNIPLVIITLGIYYPIFSMKLETFFRNNTRYGNASFQFEADPMEYFWICIKGYLLSIVTLGIYGAWFMATLQNFTWGHTSFQGKKFSSDITGGKIFVTILKVYAIVLFTLGIGMAWAINMALKVFLESVSLDSEVDFSTISAQPDTTANANAEGFEALADALEGFLG
ncbi:MAG: DUF898 domain-containing protein [Leptospira sp.]|nr:DUF898 domain-containing protein [Leptospira sp.]NCS92200.1 DUF898 domain-containing protein [Leptospira sp.]